MTRKYLLRKKTQTQSEVDINLTPMLDVVFILLIFFIVTASFVQETGMNIALSTAESAVPQQASIHIGIDSNGDIRIKDEWIDIRTLQGVLREMHLQNPHSAVIILADKASDNATLVKVLDQIHRAGIANIAVAAEIDE